LLDVCSMIARRLLDRVNGVLLDATEFNWDFCSVESSCCLSPRPTCDENCKTKSKL